MKGKEILLLKTNTNYIEKKDEDIQKKIKISDFDLGPNLKLIDHLDTIENDLFEVNNCFDVYNLLKDNSQIFLIGINKFKPKILTILKFEKNFKKILDLNSHYFNIVNCKYFCDKIIKKELIVSIGADNSSHTIIIWEIRNEFDYQNINKIVANDGIRLSFPFLLVFNNTNSLNNKYIIYPLNNINFCFYSLDENKTIKKIYNTDGYILYFLEWNNKKENSKYIVQCNQNKIYLFNIYSFYQKYIVFSELSDEILKGNNISACIIYDKNDTDFLCVSNENGKIIIYDLYSKTIKNIIKSDNYRQGQILSWSRKYLMVADKNGIILIIDFDENKIISKIISSSLTNVKSLKMFWHPIYGKYLLSGGYMIGISLWKNMFTFEIPNNI